MTLAKYRHPQHKLDSIFDDLFGNSFFKPFLDKVEHGNSVPSANIKEEDKFYSIELAVPGMKKDDLKIDLEENVLSISAENKSTSENEYKIREFNYHSFNRSFRVPKEIQGDKISAKYKDGILSINIPKMEIDESEKRKSITIS